MVSLKLVLLKPRPDREKLIPGCRNSRVNWRLYPHMPGRQRNKHRLTVIGESLLGARAALSLSRTGGVFFAGSQEAPNLLCGKCEWILVSGRLRGSLGDLVLKCPRCGAFNDTSLPFTPGGQWECEGAAPVVG